MAEATTNKFEPEPGHPGAKSMELPQSVGLDALAAKSMSMAPRGGSPTPKAPTVESVLPAPGNVRSGHYEVRYKESHDWPLAFTTIVVAMNGSTIRSARVVLGAVAPIPWRSQDAEQALVGKPLNEATAISAGEAAVRAAKPLSRNGYKVQITKTAVKRAIMQAGGITTA